VPGEGFPPHPTARTLLVLPGSCNDFCTLFLSCLDAVEGTVVALGELWGGFGAGVSEAKKWESSGSLKPCLYALPQPPPPRDGKGQS